MIRTFPVRSAALALGLVAALACASRAAGDPFTMVSMDDVERMLGKPGVTVVDANPRDVFEKNHLPGARFRDPHRPVAEVLPADRDAQLVFYCASPS